MILRSVLDISRDDPYCVPWLIYQDPRNKLFLLFHLCLQFREGEGTNWKVTRDVGAQMMNAFVAYDEGSYDNCVALMKPLKYDILKIGGSNAQVLNKWWVNSFKIYTRQGSSDLRPGHQGNITTDIGNKRKRSGILWKCALFHIKQWNQKHYLKLGLGIC